MEPDASSIGMAAQWGVLGIVSFIFALVIRHLYRDNQALHLAFRTAEADRAKEREATNNAAALERASLMTKTASEMAAQRGLYDASLAAMRREFADREDRVRKEFLETVESISGQSAEASDALKEVLLKISDRYQPPPREPRPGAAQRR